MLKKGSFFLCRRTDGDEGQLHFERVRRILQHAGPAASSSPDSHTVVLDADWFPAALRPDALLRCCCPVVGLQPTTHARGPMFPLSIVVPWHYHAMPHRGGQVMLARHWHMAAFGLGMSDR